MPRPPTIFADDVIASRRERLKKIFRKMGGTEQDCLREMVNVSGLSGSFIMKYKRNELPNPTIRSLEKLDNLLWRLEERYGYET